MSAEYFEDDSSSEAGSFKSADAGEEASTATPVTEPAPPRAPDGIEPSEASEAPAAEKQAEPDRFSPEEEAELLSASNTHKTHANSLFAQSNFDEAIQIYEKSLASCPNYLDYEIAVLRSNISACHLKLRAWKEAVESATAAVERLENLDPSDLGKASGRKEDNGGTGKEEDGGAGGVAEEVDDETAAKIERLEKSGRSREEVLRIRGKALMRRAKAREEMGGWANLAGAEEDYKYLSAMTTLSSLDRQAVQRALRSLPPRLDAAKQNEMADMMGKLKDLGNGILKPFGLSTENFQFVKDENTGGYSMNFSQNPSQNQNGRA